MRYLTALLTFATVLAVQVDMRRPDAPAPKPKPRPGQPIELKTGVLTFPTSTNGLYVPLIPPEPPPPPSAETQQYEKIYFRNRVCDEDSCLRCGA